MENNQLLEEQDSYEVIMLLYETFKKRATNKNIGLMRIIRSDFLALYNICAEKDIHNFEHFALKHPAFRRMEE